MPGLRVRECGLTARAASGLPLFLLLHAGLIGGCAGSTPGAESTKPSGPASGSERVGVDRARGERADDRVPWRADLGDGRYQNPILYADYSDPDLVAVGEDFYMTASSFNAAPGLPILHSRDLVNWRLINYALPKLVPVDDFRTPQHGNGVWAPCIRHHAGKFWIFYPDPDYGIYVTTATHPEQPWSTPKLLLAGKGLIDPTPWWDANGEAYLLHGWAKSRAGFNNVLTLHRMAPDASKAEAKGRVVIDGSAFPGYKTVEGPKLYSRNGYYYVFAPAGGVPVGWQAVFRSKSIFGPYEARVVMEQGDTSVNGPHQGAWVNTKAGEDWFVHFQSRGSYGRVVHLQPMVWRDDWPVIGVDTDGDGIGNPVAVHRKPKAPAQAPTTLPFTDDFSGPKLGLQWQWNANFSASWYSLTENPGSLRLYAQPEVDAEKHNLWSFPALLLQKLPAPEFHAQTTLSIPEGVSGVTAGLILFGEDYRWVGVRVEDDRLLLGFADCKNARAGCEEEFRPVRDVATRQVRLRITVTTGGLSVSGTLDEAGRFHTNDELFQARPGRWVGAKVGVFARVNGPKPPIRQASVDFSEFEILSTDRIAASPPP